MEKRKLEVLAPAGSFESLKAAVSAGADAVYMGGSKFGARAYAQNPEGEILLDATGKKNGRGAYLCFSRECLEKARKNHGLERSLKVSIPDEVYDSLEKEFDGIDSK